MNIQFDIQRHLSASLSDAPENVVQNKTVTIYTTSHTHFTHQNIILHTATFMHQSELIQKYIPSGCINLPLVRTRIKSIQR